MTAGGNVPAADRPKPGHPPADRVDQSTFDLHAAAGGYRRDRTEGQEALICLGVEKDGLVAQLESWFGDDLGLPVISLHGFTSQSYVDVVGDMVDADGRPTVLLHGGDFDIGDRERSPRHHRGSRLIVQSPHRSTSMQIQVAEEAPESRDNGPP